MRTAEPAPNPICHVGDDADALGGRPEAPSRATTSSVSTRSILGPPLAGGGCAARLDHMPRGGKPPARGGGRSALLQLILVGLTCSAARIQRAPTMPAGIG